MTSAQRGLQARWARRDAARRARYASDPTYRAKIRAESTAMYMRKRKEILAGNLMRYWTDPTTRDRRRMMSASSYAKAMGDPQRRLERRRLQNIHTARQRLKRKLTMTMNPAKSHALVKEWRQIVADRKAADYRMAKWAHAARAEFGPGASGDDQFFKWLETELGLAAAERIEALNLARSFKAVPDPKIWADQGAAQIRRIVELPRKEQVAVIEAAKVEGKKIGSVIRGRVEAAAARSGGKREPTARKPAAVAVARNDKAIIAMFARGLSDQDLAELLAEAIADQIVASPATVLAAAKRYASILRSRGRKAA